MKGKNAKGLEHLDRQSAKTVSANDMTGLIPANPQFPAEPYEELKPLEPAKKKR